MQMMARLAMLKCCRNVSVCFAKKLYCNTLRKYYSTANGHLSYYNRASNRQLIAMTFPDVLDRTYKKYGENEAVVDCEQNIRKNYRDYIDDIERLAAGFLSLGLQRGDRVGIFAPNCYQWILVQFAAAISGLILVAINPTSKPKELEHCLKLTGVRTLVAAEKVRSDLIYPVIESTVPEIAHTKSSTKIQQNKFPNLDSVIMISDDHYNGAWRFKDIASTEDPELKRTLTVVKKRVQVHDPVYILFTSGSTGLPKGCLLSQHSVINTLYLHGLRLRINVPGHVICASSPLFHAMGISPVALCMFHGQKLVFPSSSYSVKKLMTALHNERCTSMVGTPTMYIDILNHKDFNQYDFSALDRGGIGGASTSPETFNHIYSKLGVSDMMSGYGCTETTLIVSMTALGDSMKSVQSTVGRVQDHQEVKIVDPDGNVVPWGTPGELLVRGYNVMLGYWNDPQRTRESFTADRFYKTGDVAVLNSDGTVAIVGRIKDMILRGGENVYPKEIEDVIVMHPKVMEAHVFGIPDDRLGEVVCAWVLPKQGEHLTPDEIATYCIGEMAEYKVPYHVRIVESFPVLGTGKVNKIEMSREMKQLNLSSA